MRPAAPRRACEHRRDEEGKKDERGIDGVRFAQIRRKPQHDVEQSEQHLNRDERSPGKSCARERRTDAARPKRVPALRRRKSASRRRRCDAASAPNCPGV